MQTQTEALYLLCCPCQGAAGMFRRTALDHEIVCVPDQPADERLLKAHRLVHRMQIDVGQQRRENTTLRTAPVAIFEPTLKYAARFQPAVDQTQYLAVRHTPSQTGHQPLVIQRIEELLDIGVSHPPITRPCVHIDCGQSIVLAQPRTEPEGYLFVRDTFEVRLEDRLQHQLR